MKTEQTDVLVIGAGPAGCVAASILNKQGIKVKVVEKLKFPIENTFDVADPVYNLMPSVGPLGPV